MGKKRSRAKQVSAGVTHPNPTLPKALRREYRGLKMARVQTTRSPHEREERSPQLLKTPTRMRQIKGLLKHSN